MNFNRLPRTLSVLSICLFISHAQAQVTIGTNEAPIQGAIFQVKDKDNVIDDSYNAKKGVAFPRVELTKKDKLFPMFLKEGTIDTPTEDYTNASDVDALNKQHVGLIVYNITELISGQDIFTKGLYVWMGTEWASVGTPAVDNGLNITDQNIIKLGGTLIEPTKIETGIHNTLNIIGLEELANDSRAVVTDMQTGQLGVAGVTPTILTFVQSRTATTINANQGGSASTAPGKNGEVALTNGNVGTLNLNWGKPIIIPFQAPDIVTDNGLTDAVYSGSNIMSFRLKGKYNVEVSGYINYHCGETTGSEEVLLNVTMQVKRVSTGTWEDYSSVRCIMVNAMPWYRNTISIPPAIFEGEEGDEIRMIMIRPYNTVSGKYQFLGAPHGQGTNGSVVIDKPWGTQFSSGMKITAVG